MSKEAFRVGRFLAIRQIFKANIWVTILIIFIMMLTFLSLVAVSGLLVGIIEGGNQANQAQYTGDVIAITPTKDTYIENTYGLVQTISALPEVDRYTVRYIAGAQLEANYKTRRDQNEEPNTAGTQLAGIDPAIEHAATGLADFIVEGSYLTPGREGEIVLGANLLRRYSQDFGDGFASLENVHIGDKVRLEVGTATKEFTVIGILDSKVGEVSIRAFINDSEFKRITGRTNQNANEIAIFANGTSSPQEIKNILVQNGFSKVADIRTATEAIPQFLEDIKLAFGLIGLIVGAIGLVVSAITIFIIIFINAVTRRKFIGILKGIGITSSAIIIAYVIQALFYALVGTILGVAILYGLLVPYVASNPIDFPFSDGILAAPLSGTISRVIILLVVTFLAGLLPAWIITRKNTLDSILGR